MTQPTIWLMVRNPNGSWYGSDSHIAVRADQIGGIKNEVSVSLPVLSVYVSGSHNRWVTVSANSVRSNGVGEAHLAELLSGRGSSFNPPEGTKHAYLRIRDSSDTSHLSESWTYEAERPAKLRGLLARLRRH